MPVPGGPFQNAIDYLQNFLSGFGGGLSANATTISNATSTTQADAQQGANDGADTLAENMVAEIIDATDIPVTVEVFDNASNSLLIQTYNLDLNGVSFTLVNGTMVVNRITVNAQINVNLP